MRKIFEVMRPALGRVLLVVVASMMIAGPVSAQALGNRATMPANLDAFVNYETFHHGSLTAEALATRESLSAAKAGKNLPYGTRVLLKMYTDGTHSGFFVMEKGVNWGQGTETDDPTGDWHFQQFGVNGEVKREAIADRCQSCHSSQSSNDFVFTQRLMREFAP